MNEIIYLEKFDTEIFKFNTARLNLAISLEDLNFNQDNLNCFLQNNNIKFTIGTSAPTKGNLTFLQNNNFKFISIKSLYELCEVPNYQSIPSNFYIESKNITKFDDKNAQWLELIETIATTSHYAKNTSLSNDLHKKIYLKWFENSFSGYADKIFTIHSQDELAGLISLKIKKEQIFIDLFGIRKKFSNIGLGTILLNHAINHAINISKKIFVYTQGENIAANRCYQKNGFRIKNIELIYHKVI